MRQSTPPKGTSDGLKSFKEEFASMSGIETRTERSYSPIFRAKGLNDDDPDNLYIERIDEMALDMGNAMNYVTDLTKFVAEKEDMEILENCEDIVHDAIDKHIDFVEKMNQDLLLENEEADKALEEMLAIGAKYGYELPETPQLSIEGQKALEKEKKRKKKIAGFYDIEEDDREGNENSDDDEEEEKVDK